MGKTPVFTKCSPHTRGDGPAYRQYLDRDRRVLPTRVGMARLTAQNPAVVLPFSPHAWGWSASTSD